MTLLLHWEAVDLRGTSVPGLSWSLVDGMSLFSGDLFSVDFRSSDWSLLSDIFLGVPDGVGALR